MKRTIVVMLVVLIILCQLPKESWSQEGGRSVGKPIQSDTEKRVPLTTDLKGYDESIEHTFGLYINIQQQCCSGLQILKYLIDSKLEHVPYARLMEIRQDVLDGKLKVCEALKITTVLRDQWNELRKFPMYSAFVKQGQTEDIIEALTVMITRGKNMVKMIESSKIKLQNIKELLPRFAPTSMLRQLVAELLKLLSGFFKIITLVVGKYAAFGIAIVVSFAILIIFLQVKKGPFYFLALVMVCLEFIPPHKYLFIGEVDQLSLTIVNDILPYTRANWNNLPMTDETWANTITMHLQMHSIGQTYEGLMQKHTEMTTLVDISSWFNIEIIRVQKSSLIVKHDYSLLQSKIQQIASRYKALQSAIVSHLKNHQEFVKNLFSITTRAVSVNDILNFLDDCLSKNEELNQELENIIFKYQGIGNDLKGLQVDINLHEMEHKMGRINAVVGSGSILLFSAFLTVATLGLAVPITAPLAAGGAIVGVTKYSEHSQHSAILTDLVKHLDQFHSDVQKKRELMGHMTTEEIKESFRILRRILDRQATAVPLQQENMKYYFSEAEKSVQKYLQKLNDAINEVQANDDNRRIA